MRQLKPKEYLRRYLKVTPLALAIFRAIEAKNIFSEAMGKPILDIGCGFGEFSGVCFQSQVAVGLDKSFQELVTAQKTKSYKKLVWADAQHLPFADQSFQTVLSVSAFEHMEGVSRVLKEAFRVLKPGGKLVFTVNQLSINQMLFWPKVFRQIGLVSLAKSYTQLYHQVFKHKTLWSKQTWQQTLSKTGFKIKVLREIISLEALQLFDLFLLTAWPSQIIKIISGKRRVWRPAFLSDWLVEKYGWLVEREESRGSNLFVAAVKPLHSNQKT